MTVSNAEETFIRKGSRAHWCYIYKTIRYYILKNTDTNDNDIYDSDNYAQIYCDNNNDYNNEDNNLDHGDGDFDDDI